jgi:hypothetical protein
MSGSNVAPTDAAGVSGEDVVRTSAMRFALEPGNA